MEEKLKRKDHLDGYFTVEASLILPVVFVCCYVIIILLCYSYERCIWEQNAFRLPVWKTYIEGYLNMYPESAEAFSEEDILGYILVCLDTEERQKYLFVQEIVTEINVQGQKVCVTRSGRYPMISEESREITLSTVCMKPTVYIRAAELLIEQSDSNERDNNDKE